MEGRGAGGRLGVPAQQWLKPPIALCPFGCRCLVVGAPPPLPSPPILSECDSRFSQKKQEKKKRDGSNGTRQWRLHRPPLFPPLPCLSGHGASLALCPSRVNTNRAIWDIWIGAGRQTGLREQQIQRAGGCQPPPRAQAAMEKLRAHFLTLSICFPLACSSFLISEGLDTSFRSLVQGGGPGSP